jgi:iduronate 2-sulfatase
MKSLVVFAVMSAMASAGHALGRPNVLLILVDDLKPALGCYGDTDAISPHIDRLAARGMRFDNAYCNQAVCAPSRFTFMLGSHSTSSGLYGLGSHLRTIWPDAVTLPQHFARHGGYRTESLGKIYHIGHGNFGDPDSFTVPHFADKVVEYLLPESTEGGRLTREEALFTNRELGNIRSLPRGAAWEAPDVADDAYADGRVAAETCRRLHAAAERRRRDGTPFFIAAGFVRPHLPFSAPKRYWDLYDPARLPLPHCETLPLNAPAVAGKRGGEIAAYKPVPEKGEYGEELKRNLIHGYYASLSYVDAQIGRVIDALDASGLADSTVVVLWGDHGWHLGDLGIWTKHTNYEQANRIPLLIIAPGVAKPGSVSGQMISTVDLYPTLADLAGLPPPGGPQPVDGISMKPVLLDPALRLRDHVYHIYPRAKKLGRAIRTERYRLVEWRGYDGHPDSIEYELYDYRRETVERENIYAAHPDTAETLKSILAQYPPAVPQSGFRPR